MTPHIQRAQLLYQQSRYQEALQELQAHLAQAPEDAGAYALMALNLAGLKRYREAREHAQHAIHLDPGDPFHHYAHGWVHYQEDQPALALRAAQEALALDPEDPDVHALAGAIHLHQCRWEDARAAAERALVLNAEHVEANNVLAAALTKLGRGEEAGRTMAAALARDPENAYSHANQGWTLLHQGNHQRALEHFREALRLDPNLEWARDGVVQALQAHYPLYRWFLKYFLWMSRFSRRGQWAVVVGLYIAYRVAASIGRDVPESRWITVPLIVGYLLFAYFSWTANSMFNMVLRFHPFGRWVLSPTERIGSTLHACCIVAAVIAGGLFFLNRQPVWLLAAIGCLLYVIPLAATFRCTPGRRQWILAGWTIILGLLGVVGLAGGLLGQDEVARVGVFYFVGAVLFTWVGNALVR